MKCINVQDDIMLYIENRLENKNALALHKHIQKCEPCRQLFLAMDSAKELEFEEFEINPAPGGFTAAVMAKITALPIEEHPVAVTAESPVEKTASKLALTDWLRIAGGLYALVLAIGLGVLYNTDLI